MNISGVSCVNKNILMKYNYKEENVRDEHKKYMLTSITYTSHGDESCRVAILEVKETAIKIHTMTIQITYCLKVECCN